MTTTDKDLFFDIHPDTYSQWAAQNGLPKYCLEQVSDWITKHHCLSFDDMTNISKKNRSILADRLRLNPFTSVTNQKASDGLATKYIFTLDSGVCIEAVALQERGYETLCVSSQAGCPVDCKFCLTGISGLKRNLTVSEIVGQLAIVLANNHHITHIVFMGMGEPLLNLKAVLPAMDWFQEPWGFHISRRHITVSTSGYEPGIDYLIKNNRYLNLAFSVGSAIPSIRETIMPIEKRYPITQLSLKLRQYSSQHNRKLTLEYTLLATVNDTDLCADQLIQLARFLNAKVNLINLNPHPMIPFEPVSHKHLMRFRQRLVMGGVQTTIRHPKGQDIVAACGQLQLTAAADTPISRQPK